MPDDRFVTEKTAAGYLSISRTTMRCWRHQRVGPPYHVLGKRAIRYAVSDLQIFANSRRVVPEEV